MKYLSLALILITLAITPAQAEDKLDEAPKTQVLETIPTNLELPDQKGVVRSFDELKGINGAVVIFFRSAKWCPYCQVQLMEYELLKDDIKELGYNIIGVSYDDLHVLDLFATRKHISFTLLSDKLSKNIKAFGILNEDISKDHKAYGVPHPAVYIVNEDKEIVAKLTEEGYKKRPTVEDVVKAINHYEIGAKVE